MSNIYKNADMRRKVKPGGVVEPEEESKVEETTTEQPAPEPLKETEPPCEEKEVELVECETKPSEAVKSPAKDILADLIPKEKKPKGGTAGFYLSERVQNEIERLAKANKVSKSKYLEILLTRVFFGE